MALQKRTEKVFPALLIASFLNGLMWSALIPMWHTPDEQAHFAQAQDLAALGYRPTTGFSTSQDIVLSEKYLGVFRDERGNNRFTYHPEYNIEDSNSAYGLYEKELMAMPVELRSIFAINEATGYPPLYYLYISAMNKQFWSLDLIYRLFLSRVGTVLLSVGLGVVVFYIGKILFKKIFYAYVLAALAVFQPMRMFVGSGVTSDALFNLVYPSAVLAGILFYRRPDLKRLVWLLAAVLAVILTKPQSILLFFWLSPIALISVFCKNSQAKMAVRAAVTAGLFFGAIILGVNLLATLTPRLVEPLTKTIFKNSGIPDVTTYQSHQPSLREYLSAVTNELYTQTLPWYWGVYRWLSLTLPVWVYRVIKIVMVVSLVGLMAGFKKIKAVANLRPLAWLIGSSVVYTFGIYAWNLLFWRSKGFSFGIQGRYFLPNLPEHMAILLVGLLVFFPERIRKAVGFTLAALMILFNWFSLWFVSQSYYGAIINYQTFFLRASQYKPWFFKTPFLPVVVILVIIFSALFLYLLYDLAKRDDK